MTEELDAAIQAVIDTVGRKSMSAMGEQEWLAVLCCVLEDKLAVSEGMRQ